MTNFKKRERSIYSIAFLIIFSLIHFSCEESKDDALETDPKEVIIYDLEAGDFEGSWVISGYNEATAKIAEQTEGVFKGDFYYTNHFTSCCGSDASIDFKIIDNRIVGFEVETFVPGCEGLFSGSGTLKDDNHIEIKFNGENCFGPSEGTLILKILVK